ncbi:MAG: peroxide stress protein YaaA [Eubacterium sp.]|nr:peroxide stress protein YaaA [Lachnospiraceae bacterium]MBO5487391.1 peroxide stress protein YaaA [Eubacterium sp.]
MRIIISPAKKMNEDTDTLSWKDLPVFLETTEQIMDWMKSLSCEEARKLWQCNEKLAELNFRRFREMDLKRNLTPALISYEGIQYQYMAPLVFLDEEWDYVQKNLRILSGFYGVLKPLDGVTPYRLEMQAKAKIGEKQDLYEFWGSRIYKEVLDESRVIINLASKEYSKCIESYLQKEDKLITCIFGELKDGKVVQKGTMAKMARGEMVRFMAEKGIENPQDMKAFDRLGYCFREEFSCENEYVFIRELN